MLGICRDYAVGVSYSGEHTQEIRALQRLGQGGMTVGDTHLEMTYEGILTAIDGQAERGLTSEEFSEAFEQMAERLYEIDGLVDPILWGQASTGKIELEFGLLSSGDTKKTAARAIAVIAEVSAAGGIGLDWCSDPTQHGQDSVCDRIQIALNPAPECPRLVLHGAHRANEVCSQP